jgi:hypothetical protein
MSETIAAPQAGAPGQEPSQPGGPNGEPPIGKSGAMLFSTLVLAHYRYFILNARYGELGGIPKRFEPHGAREIVGDGKAPSSAQTKEARLEYEAALKRFEKSEGRIQKAYWCIFAPSGIAVTEKAGARFLRFWRHPPVVRLYRESDWLTNAYGDITLLLHHCDTIAMKAARVLRGTAMKIAIEWVFSEQRFLLAAAEERTRLRLEMAHGRRSGGSANGGSGTAPEASGNPSEGSETKGDVGPATTPTQVEHPSVTAADLVPAEAPSSGPEIGSAHTGPPLPSIVAALARPAPPHSELMEHAKKELLAIERFYDRAANKAGRVMYFWGMVTGFVAALALAALMAFIVHETFVRIELDGKPAQNFFVCFAAGALGAVVSVLMRMRNPQGFEIDYEAGRWQAFWLGSIRPFIGAIFGLIIYFAIDSDLLQIVVPDQNPATDASDASFSFLALLAFVAGFSERLTKVVLDGTDRSIRAVLGGDEGQASAPLPPAVSAERLEWLMRLREQGRLTDEELESARRLMGA